MAQPVFAGGGSGRFKELPSISEGTLPAILRKPPRIGTPGINPNAGKPPLATADPAGGKFHLEPRGGMDTSPSRSAGVTPIGRFAVVLLLFALAILFLPKGVRGWFVLIILLGAFAANPGAIKEFQGWLGV